VTEARETTRKQVTEDLEQKFKTTLEESTGQLRAEFERSMNQLKEDAERSTAQLKADAERSAGQLRAEFAAERERIQQQLQQWRVFAEGQRQMAEASSQAEILARFLKFAESLASGLAVYVTKADGLALWKHRGKTFFPEIISEETTDPESYFRTISVRGKTVAAVSATAPFKAEALDFLGSAMEQAIEVYGLKLRAPLQKTAGAAQTTVAGAASSLVQPMAEESPADIQKAQAEARRTARLLISEIKLYHEDELKAGREHSDIYERLRNEIDQGRETYSQRVPKVVAAGGDYYHEELVRILAENDPARLGGQYPGAKRS
jgi:hypothetical protein